ncbi:MAG: type II secretion system protein [Lachnospiraceae bacterium]|nr:type II secretion system protein [Lachnospiraceae bacterium]
MKNKNAELTGKAGGGLMVHQNSGFTLVELVVSFVIILMIAAMSVVGVLAYQDYADYRRQNNYAETLFVAAQSKVTGYSVRGQMKRLEAVAVNPLDMNTVITPEGIMASESDRATNIKQGTVYYLTGNKEAYTAYLNGEYENKTDMTSVCYQTLYDLFDEYLFDKSVLHATIAVEFSPEQGQVYSVLYSDKCGAFTYTEENKSGIVNVLNRQEDYRSEYMIGYYGLD